MTRPRVAVLGAGILGTCLSLHLSRLGADVTLVDRATAPMEATSRWNEGKIHLGYLYGADPTLATARHLLTGGLAFADVVSDLVGEDVRTHATTSDDLYLVHSDSLVEPDALRRQFEAVSELVRQHPDAARYLADVSDAQVRPLPLDSSCVEVSTRVEAAFVVPERSVNTHWVADRLAAAVAADDRISRAMGTTVRAVEPTRPGARPVLSTDQGDVDGPYDVVVNALWEGRLVIDATAGLVPDHAWTHRYRLCAFVRTTHRVDHPSAVVAVGPFGDVKNYDGRDFYLSWYPVGLVAESSELVLPPVPWPTGAEAHAFVSRLRAGLETCLPAIGEVLDAAERVQVGGGFVFARGTGSIGDARSGLHRRDAYGATWHGRYVSVDTGKYSTAPWAARQLAADIMEIR